LESSIIIIIYFIIINAYYNYCLSNEVFLEECNEDDNLEVAGDATTS